MAVWMNTQKQLRISCFCFSFLFSLGPPETATKPSISYTSQISYNSEQSFLYNSVQFVPSILAYYQLTSIHELLLNVHNNNLTYLKIRYREISLNIVHVIFSVFYSIEVLIWRGTCCWKPHLNRTSGSKVLSNWRILKTIENKRNSPFLAISHNQCSRLLTDSARLQHKWLNWSIWPNYTNFINFEIHSRYKIRQPF